MATKTYNCHMLRIDSPGHSCSSHRFVIDPSIFVERDGPGHSMYALVSFYHILEKKLLSFQLLSLFYSITTPI